MKKLEKIVGLSAGALLVAGSAIGILCTACPSPSGAIDAAPFVPPTFDGSTTKACFLACQALSTAGCAEGAGNCVTRLQTVVDLKSEVNTSTHHLLTCDDLETVKTPADVVAVGQKCTLEGGK
jgi:hypothetical protein